MSAADSGLQFDARFVLVIVPRVVVNIRCQSLFMGRFSSGLRHMYVKPTTTSRWCRHFISLYIVHCTVWFGFLEHFENSLFKSKCPECLMSQQLLGHDRMINFMAKAIRNKLPQSPTAIKTCRAVNKRLEAYLSFNHAKQIFWITYKADVPHGTKNWYARQSNIQEV